MKTGIVAGVLVAAVAGIAIGLLATWPTGSVQSPLLAVGAGHSYPTPDYWPASALPVGVPHAGASPRPQVTVAPCPSGEVPTTAIWNGKKVPACQVPGGLPPDPGTGPLCAGVNGGPATIATKELDGSYDCG